MDLSLKMTKICVHHRCQLVETNLGLVNNGGTIIKKNKDIDCLSFFTLLELVTESGYKNVAQVLFNNLILGKKFCANLHVINDDSDMKSFLDLCVKNKECDVYIAYGE